MSSRLGRGAGAPDPRRPGRRRPALSTAALGARVDLRRGRLEYLGTVEPAVSGPRQAPRGNSAQRLKQVHDAFVLGDGLAAAVAGHQGPIRCVRPA